MSTVLMIVIGCIVVLVAFVIGIFNRLVTLKLRTGEAWSQIDVQLKRRSDLVPNLVETVKGYAAHEKSVFENVTKARAMINEAGGDVGKTLEANNMLTGALKSLFAVAEAYPDLKANQNFLMLQEELTSTEDRVAYARQFYNDSVLNYNNKIQTFPRNVIANSFSFQKREFFEVAPEDTGPVKVQF